MGHRFRVQGEGAWADALRARLDHIDRALLSDSSEALTILPASTIRPAFTLDVEMREDADSRAATALGASIVAWEGGDRFIHWHHCFAPIETSPVCGIPDHLRTWLLVDASLALTHIPVSPTSGWQWHVLVRTRMSLPDHVVQWRAHPATSAALLGASTAIVGEDGPLLYDAWRLRRTVFKPALDAPVETWSAHSHPDFHPALANTIPPLLAESPAFWRLLADSPVTPIMRPAQIRDARKAAALAERSPWVRVHRELLKLRHEPVKTLREARIWLVRTLGSRARSPGRRRSDAI